MIKCPKCGLENLDNARNCSNSNCRVNLQFALENAEKMQAQWQAEREQDQHIPQEDRDRNLAEIQKISMLQRMFIATIPVIQGRTISKYLGIASSAFVLGTGLFSEINASFADIFGTESGGYQEKLAQARELVTTNMKEQAHESGGDGIIGIEFDYMTIGHNMIMVSASGTIVKFETKTTTPEEQL